MRNVTKNIKNRVQILKSFYGVSQIKGKFFEKKNERAIQKNWIKKIPHDVLQNLPFRFLYISRFKPSKQTFMYVLREAKRKLLNIVSGCSCIDGRNSAWIKPQHPDEGSSKRRVNVKSLEKLKTFCSYTLHTNLESLNSRWPGYLILRGACTRGALWWKSQVFLVQKKLYFVLLWGWNKNPEKKTLGF